MPPSLVFGTATLGMDLSSIQDSAATADMLEQCLRDGISHLDTAARYPPRNPGRAEQLLGETVHLTQQFVVDSKVLVTTDRDGSLTKEAIEQSVEASLKRLKLSKLNILYAHWCDLKTPLEEQVRAFNSQIDQGRCAAWGVSNHPVEHLEKLLAVCEELGLRKPAVYQGEYNMLTRGADTALLPLLRKHGMRFCGFQPLASGFLTGKVATGQTAGSRFADDSPIGAALKSKYNADGTLSAVRTLMQELEELNLSITEVALRWIFHHSQLADGDSIILGASRKQQLDDNTAAIRKGPLSDEAVQCCERLWESVKDSRAHIM